MKYLVIILSLALLACESSVVRREDYLAKHPEWDANSKELTKQGYLFKGMSKEQVEAAWGKPCQSCTGTDQGDWGETWEYPTQIVYFDNKGVLLRWSAK
jgi:hypothetical protein